MRNDIDTAEFFNQLSLSTFEAMAGESAEDIFSKLRSLEVRFGDDITELIELSVGNKPRTMLLRSAGVELIRKALLHLTAIKTSSLTNVSY